MHFMTLIDRLWKHFTKKNKAKMYEFNRWRSILFLAHFILLLNSVSADFVRCIFFFFVFLWHSHSSGAISCSQHNTNEWKSIRLSFTCFVEKYRYEKYVSTPLFVMLTTTEVSVRRRGTEGIPPTMDKLVVCYNWRKSAKSTQNSNKHWQKISFCL